MSDNDTIELDDYARGLWATYAELAKKKNEIDAVRVKARDQLMDWFAVQDATRGTINGEHVVTYSTYGVDEFDSRAFREDQPALWAAYAHRAPRRRLITHD